MIFNSAAFLVFYVVVAAAYFLLPHRARWMLLLGASCYFYMCFVPVYILILLATIVVDYYAAIWIHDSTDPVRKRWYLSLSIVSVCAILFVFKYYNFFNANLEALAGWLHWNYPLGALRIVLPIGLSFHTFQSLSYVVEVYRGRQVPERHFGYYALYVMYFPQLVAGPIERPQNLLHQFREPHGFDGTRLRDGLTLALWGLFKKAVVADTVAIYVDAVYRGSAHHTGTTLLLATYLFAIQIYCDFSGYSDIARGVSKVFGIDLMKNFETPYFAASVTEFWSRWHISLSTWFRDYLYIPLGGNRVPLRRQIGNLFCVFLLSGLWHGANWTFLVWGALHGAFVTVERLLARVPARWSAAAALPPGLARAGGMLVTFHLVLLAWVFFRADSVTAAFAILGRIAVNHGPVFWDPLLVPAFLGIAALLALEVFHLRTDFWNRLDRFSLPFRFAYSLALIFALVLFGVDNGAQFIYFQF